MTGDSEDGDNHAIVVPPNMSGGKRVHPLPYIDSNLPGMISHHSIYLFNARNSINSTHSSLAAQNQSFLASTVIESV